LAPISGEAFGPGIFTLGAGDGTRTRDALLGRQALTFSPLGSSKAPSIQHFSPQYIIRPKTRQLPTVSGTSCHGMCSDCNRGHTSPRLRVPDHVHLMFLPPYSPELQPAEHLWPLTNTVLATCHFATIDVLEDAQAERCVALQSRPDPVRSSPPPCSHGGQSASANDTGQGGLGITC